MRHTIPFAIGPIMPDGIDPWRLPCTLCRQTHDAQHKGQHLPHKRLWSPVRTFQEDPIIKLTIGYSASPPIKRVWLPSSQTERKASLEVMPNDFACPIRMGFRQAIDKMPKIAVDGNGSSHVIKDPLIEQ